MKNSQESEQVKGPETKNTSSTKKVDGGEKVGTEPVKDNRSDAGKLGSEKPGASNELSDKAKQADKSRNGASGIEKQTTDASRETKWKELSQGREEWRNKEINKQEEQLKYISENYKLENNDGHDMN